MSVLAEKECIPCKGGAPPLKGTELSRLQGELAGEWKVVGEHHLEKDYRFKNFREALDFTIKTGNWRNPKAITPISISPGGRSS